MKFGCTLFSEEPMCGSCSRAASFLHGSQIFGNRMKHISLEMGSFTVTRERTSVVPTGLKGLDSQRKEISMLVI